MRKFIRTTLIGGVLFLVPLVVTVVLVGKAFEILKSVAEPLSRSIPVEYFGGIAPVVVITVVIMILLCFLAGMFARSKKGRQIQSKIEGVLMQVVPGYAWTKGMTGSMSDDEAQKILKPVVVKFEEMWQIGFEVDRMENGMVTVYLPAAPNAREGSIAFVDADRIDPVSAEINTVYKTYKMMGLDAADMLGGSRVTS